MLPVRRADTAFFGPWPTANRLASLFDQAFADGAAMPGAPWSGLPVAIWEDEDRVYIEAELPGMKAEDVDVTVHNGLLFIRGERKPEGGRTYLYNGRSYGRFERVIRLPETVTSHEVEGRLTDGVLHVALAKSPAARPKKIEIRAS